jgi:hypothetical protein
MSEAGVRVWIGAVVGCGLGVAKREIEREKRVGGQSGRCVGERSKGGWQCDTEM